MSEKTEKALELHKKGLNCAQSVALPFCEELGLDPVTVSKGMEGFGAGMGGFELTCGALSAAIYIVGSKNADGNLDRPASKRETYALAKLICKRFEEECGSHLCCEIKGLRGGKVLKSCDECIVTAVRLAEEILSDKLTAM